MIKRDFGNLLDKKGEEIDRVSTSDKIAETANKVRVEEARISVGQTVKQRREALEAAQKAQQAQIQPLLPISRTEIAARIAELNAKTTGGYREKYLKYKAKYLALKAQLGR